MTGFAGKGPAQLLRRAEGSRGAAPEPGAVAVPQRQAGAGVEHQRHCGTAQLPLAPAIARGPLQAVQRAGSRQVSHTSDGA